MIQMNKSAITLQIDPPATPEPLIGPGMILERGRERVLITEVWKSSGELYTRVQRRWPVCRWPIGWNRWGRDLYRSDIPLMLADGWRVIREADPKPPA